MRRVVVALALIVSGFTARRTFAHHSRAMFDQTKQTALVGKIGRAHV